MIRYQQPRTGIFNIHSGKYGKNGWINNQEAHQIIGETAVSYTTRYLESSTPYWDEMGKYECWYTIAIGIHKSRFVCWETTQLQLF